MDTAMRTRKLALGSKNIIGARVTLARRSRQMTQKQLMAQLQTLGMDISAPALSLLEAQKRPVTDRELAILARVLEVSPLWLLGWEEIAAGQGDQVPHKEENKASPASL